MKYGYLILQDGTTFKGTLYGYKKETSGEIVFNTCMTGYTNSMTDPSYYGQILVFTYPLIGNWGVLKNMEFESEKIQVKGIVVSEISKFYSHFNSVSSLHEWCFKNKIPILSGIDTRYLTQILRKFGTMLGGIFFKKKDNLKFDDINKINLVKFVSNNKIQIIAKPNFKYTVVLYDLGVKKSIITSLLKRKIRIIKVPWNFNIDKLKVKFSGVVISNGPGDPKNVKHTIKEVQKIIRKDIPILGICLGNQIIALALGADTYKLKFGHRSLNQPVLNEKTKKAFITSQNHGYAVDIKSLPKNLKVWFKNLNDGTCEGLYHTKKRIISTQFHPEAKPGPKDTEWIFNEFLEMIK